MERCSFSSKSNSKGKIHMLWILPLFLAYFNKCLDFFIFLMQFLVEKGNFSIVLSVSWHAAYLCYSPYTA